MWCPHCQRREEISHVQTVSPSWLSHGPLTTLGAFVRGVILLPVAIMTHLPVDLFGIGSHQTRTFSCTLFYGIPHSFACTTV